ncbi:hypothetical protein G3N94_39300 [Burkholderia sp. Ac-20353]|nr:hypothetical protein [Burkholderia sp. Ac-20353]
MLSPPIAEGCRRAAGASGALDLVSVLPAGGADQADARRPRVGRTPLASQRRATIENVTGILAWRIFRFHANS